MFINFFAVIIAQITCLRTNVGDMRSDLLRQAELAGRLRRLPCRI